MNRFLKDNQEWYNAQTIRNASFVCGYCGDKISSNRGYAVHQANTKPPQCGGAYICSNCGGITFMTPAGTQMPSPAIGKPVDGLPEEVEELYEEARKCTTTSCFTASVMCSRKMLMNLAVQKGASEGLKYIEYVDYLSQKGFVPPDSEAWVDHIRSKGNEANHEIKTATQEDAKTLLSFVEMLLRFVYEFPKLCGDGSENP